jgi:hypothetical protein
MSSSAGSFYELTQLPAHQTMSAFVVGNKTLGFGLSVYIWWERMGTITSAGVEHPRVGMHSASCLSVPSAALTLGLGLALVELLPVFKVLIKREYSGPISSLCLNAAAICAWLGALPWVPGL